jgi:hypothetical protein
MPTEEIEKALDPKRLVKIFGRVFLAIVLGIALVVGVRMAYRTANTVEATSYDHAWFTETIEEIHVLDRRIAETREAASRHQKDVDSRWVSRSDDRAETQTLTHQLLDLQEQRSELEKEYNVAAELATSEVLGALPKRVPASEEHEH